MNRSTSDYVFWKINPGSGRQRGIGGDEVKGHLLLMKYKALVDHVLVHVIIIRKAARRLIYRVLHYLHITITVHSSSISDEKQLENE